MVQVTHSAPKLQLLIHMCSVLALRMQSPCPGTVRVALDQSHGTNYVPLNVNYVP